MSNNEVMPQIEIAKDFSSGAKIIKLLNVKALNDVCKEMSYGFRHTFGLDDHEELWGFDHYVLRDANEKAKAILLVTDDQRLNVSVGHSGKNPDEGDLPYIGEFIQENKLAIGVPVQNTGLVLWKDNYHSVYQLPENVILFSDTSNMNDLSVFKDELVLPNKMHVVGDITLNGDQFDPKDYRNDLKQNWNVSGNVTYVWKNELGQLHRDIDPASITLGDEVNAVLPQTHADKIFNEMNKRKQKTSATSLYQWYENGALHRKGAPAQILDFLNPDKEDREEAWHVNGKLYEPTRDERIKWSIECETIDLKYIY